MKSLIKRILREYLGDDIQSVEFDGFSDPILIPQFKLYIVKFNGTSKDEKIPQSEKIIFKDKTSGKEYVFNSNDVQKSGSSPFYISLDVLKRNYDIKFKDEFIRHKQNLTTSEYNKILKEIGSNYKSEGRCKTKKCDELRDTIESSLKEMYDENYGDYDSSVCEPTKGFLNVYPMLGTTDDSGNKWSKLNYIIFREDAASSLTIAYLKEFGTFEHNDFIQWIKENKGNLFKGPFLELMFRNVQIPKQNNVLGNKLLEYIKMIFPNAEIINSFCPTTKSTYGETIVVSNDGEKIVFQPVTTKSKSVLDYDDKYYILFGRRGGAPMINRRADYIITNSGVIFENSNVLTGDRAWAFDNPPIYNIYPYISELKKFTKLR